MTRRKRIMLIVGAVILLFIIFIGVNMWLAMKHAATFPTYWQDKASEPVAANAIRLVAFGDSTTQAIGAVHPMDGFVGRIAKYVESKTGRPVHIANLSEGGAGIEEVVRYQLPKADLENADIIVMSTSTDLEHRNSIDNYRANLEKLAKALPAKKAIFPIYHSNQVEENTKKYWAR